MSPWRALAQGAGWFAVVIVGNAIVQALLVAVDPTEPLVIVSELLAVVSGAALVIAGWLLWRAAGARPTGLLWRSVVFGAAIALAAILFPYFVPVVIAVGSAVLGAGGWRAAGATVRAHPVRTVLRALVTIIVVVLCWAGALLAGLLIAGVAAAVTSWIGVGIVAAVMACHWAVRSAR